MGGTIDIDSQPGVGTRLWFHLCLPAATTAVRALPSSAHPGVRLRSDTAPRILVADDVDENRDVLVRMLSQLGAEISEAADGQQALTTLQQRPFDLVLMDIRMPVMNGIEAVRRIRAEFATPPVCIAITASAMTHEIEAILAEGFDALIAKPFRYETLCEHLQRYLPVYYEAISSSDSTPPTPTDGGVVANLPASAAANCRIPDALQRRLHQAMAAYWMSDVQNCLDQIATLGEAEASLANRLRALNSQHGLQAMEQELCRVGLSATTLDDIREGEAN